MVRCPLIQNLILGGYIMKRFNIIFSLIVLTSLACSDALLAMENTKKRKANPVKITQKKKQQKINKKPLLGKRKANPVKLKKKKKQQKINTAEQQIQKCAHCNEKLVAGEDVITKLQQCHHTV